MLGNAAQPSSASAGWVVLGSNSGAFLLFPGLGLVAVAFVLLARRYSTSALGVGLAGLLTLTTASTWVISGGPNTASTGGLGGIIEELRARIDDGDKRVLAAEQRVLELDQLKGQLEAAQSKRKEAESKTADSEKEHLVATFRIAGLNEKLDAAEKAKVAAESQVAVLEDKLRNVTVLPLPPKPPDLQRVRRVLAEGLRPFFLTQDERELVPGRKGSWHIVRLLMGGEEWRFADREFVLSDAERLKASATQFRDEVLLPLDQVNTHWTLFVRGAADPRRVTGPTGRDLYFLPRTPEGVHAALPKGKRVTIPIENDDLPILRADWLREIVGPVLGTRARGDIAILENSPRPGHGRTAELVLFIEW